MPETESTQPAESDAADHPAPCLAPHRSCVCDLFRPPSACAFPGCTEQHPWRALPPTSTTTEAQR